jgi:hypothetical protein
VVTHAEYRHGQFEAKNIDVQFLNWEEFLAAATARTPENSDSQVKNGCP